MEVFAVPPAVPDLESAGSPIGDADNIRLTVAVPVAYVHGPPGEAGRETEAFGVAPGGGLVEVRVFRGVLVKENAHLSLWGDPDVVVDTRAGQVAPVDAVACEAPRISHGSGGMGRSIIIRGKA